MVGFQPSEVTVDLDRLGRRRSTSSSTTGRRPRARARGRSRRPDRGRGLRPGVRPRSRRGGPSQRRHPAVRHRRRPGHRPRRDRRARRSRRPGRPRAARRARHDPGLLRSRDPHPAGQPGRQGRSGRRVRDRGGHRRPTDVILVEGDADQLARAGPGGHRADPDDRRLVGPDRRRSASPCRPGSSPSATTGSRSRSRSGRSPRPGPSTPASGSSARAAGSRTTSTSDRILVTIGGSVADLDRLSGTALVADLDVSGLQPGTSVVPVTLELPTGATLVSATPSTVTRHHHAPRRRHAHPDTDGRLTHGPTVRHRRDPRDRQRRPQADDGLRARPGGRAPPRRPWRRARRSARTRADPGDMFVAAIAAGRHEPRGRCPHRRRRPDAGARVPRRTGRVRRRDHGVRLAQPGRRQRAQGARQRRAQARRRGRGRARAADLADRGARRRRQCRDGPDGRRPRPASTTTAGIGSAWRRSIPAGALRVVLDCANGSGCPLGAEILAATGAEVEVIHADPDGININVDCGATAPHRWPRRSSPRAPTSASRSTATPTA